MFSFYLSISFKNLFNFLIRSPKTFIYNDILSFTDATQRESFFKSFYELRAKIMFGTNYTPEQLSQTKTMFDVKFGGAN